MKDIEVDYVIGDNVKILRIEFMAQGHGYMLMDNRFHGQAVYGLLNNERKWMVYLNDVSELNNADDISILEQILNRSS